MKWNGHIYWKRKARFDLAEDLYPAWTLFAVEEGSFRFEIVQEPGDRESRPERLSSSRVYAPRSLSDVPGPSNPSIRPNPTISANSSNTPVLPDASNFSVQPLETAGEAGFGAAVLCPPGGILRRETVAPLTFHYLQFERGNTDGLLPPGGGLLTFEDTRRLSSDYAYLRQAADDDSPAAAAWKAHLTLDLLRLHAAERMRGSGDSARFTEDALMARAAEEIEVRFDSPLQLESLARELGLSPVQFTRRFRAAFGETPSRFLRSVRLSRARRLLDETELTLAAIAERCGYENGFYLSRVFAAETGVSPSAYRRRRRV
ncbi:AraC family transcriptional regulator [Saccharibacillus sp. CPCC 101409]|uniref:helix-turn-helix domain-containing protein n=1 Tax=Saccharibacillus sp. CPCC 101409 TaxID=3058041 RepID=UPI0026718AD2|nr:AraC family transcriptional regulator [Saccharibacillus sp. CPCC 101409]MDO3411183.1 AraC family transcriptional regulator [Saccharibacillus sp. CPCC 101409]